MRMRANEPEIRMRCEMSDKQSTTRWTELRLRKRRAAGVTLLELMIVVTVVAILASIAIPSYSTYARRAQRSDAMSALLQIAANQEKYYLQNNTYGTLAQLNISSTERGWYTLAITNAAGAAPDARTFRATATAISSGPQFADDSCRTFSVDSAGQRGALNAANADNTQQCWR